MDPTRQTWTAAAIVVILAGLTPLTGSLVPVVGATTVSGWLLAVQIAAVRSFRSTAATATVQVDPDATRMEAGTAVSITATVERPDTAAETAVTVTVPTPPVAEPIPETERRVELAPSETQASTTFDVRVPVAGRFRLSKPIWLVMDPTGSVTESYSRGSTPELHVVEAAARELHIGRGGRETWLFGERAERPSGTGIVPERLRPYEQTDPANRIDWKTTARLGEPYLRETNTQSGRVLRVLVDHRAKMRLGPADEPMFEYARDVALGVAATAQQSGDPLGLITVGNDGLTNMVDPTYRSTGYAELRRRIRALEPIPTEQPGPGVELDHPESARRLRFDLEASDHEFGRVLHEFATASAAYVSAAGTQPLVRAVQYHHTATPSARSTVIVTDDTDRDETWKAVRTALQSGASVFVFLTPRVLFESEQGPHTEQVSERYLQFERYRRRLDRLDSVRALEVAPARRLAEVRSTAEDELGEPSRARPEPTNGSMPATAPASNGGSND